ncbi:MAG: glycerol kinase GlpK [Bacilli bacterium]|jgi:glycerol kinase|nr:glycerol kinase GlpK [Bacilli bacterium]
MNKYLLTIDQGTTSTRAIIFDKKGKIKALSSKEIKCLTPQPSYVEQDPLEILASVKYVLKSVFNNTNINPSQIDSIGITNQRETTILWDKNTGKPVYNAIVWQSKQSNYICEELINKNYQQIIKDKTGLPIDSYFSATKIKWIMEHVDGLDKKIANNEILFGTVDTWLLWNLSINKVHYTDYSNASRTMLFNIKDLQWDDELLKILNIPRNILPKVVDSSMIYDYINPDFFFDNKIPIASMIGDQQAALFGQACFNKGDLKNTYGTGCFLLLNTKDNIVDSKNGLITTIAWGINNKIDYALEGSIFVAGSAVQFLRDNLKIIYNAAQTEEKASLVKDNGGVYFVPTFSGLGSPYWNMDVKGALLGITRATTNNHIIRATLEAIAYQTKDIINIIEKDAKCKVTKLKVDGGASENKLLMQFQSDILNIDIEQPSTYETTALGAALLAGLATSYFKDYQEIIDNYTISKTYKPQMNKEEIDKLYQKWKLALETCMKFI